MRLIGVGKAAVSISFHGNHTHADSASISKLMRLTKR